MSDNEPGMINEYRFGDFLFEVWPDLSNPRDYLKLLKHGEPVPVAPRALEVLFTLVNLPAKAVVGSDELFLKVWGKGKDSTGNLDQQISALRKALNDTTEPRRFVESVPPKSYRFAAPIAKTQRRVDQIVRLPGDPVTRVHADWQQFDHILSNVRRTPDSTESQGEGDLRIATIAFTSGGAPEDVLRRLLRQDVRIKILLTNPRQRDILTARNARRAKEGGDLESPEEALDALEKQIHRLNVMREALRTWKGCRGTLDLRLSDLMPCAFVAHSSQWALLGLFWATDSYGAGPMIEVAHDTELWKALRRDWLARWEDGEEVPTPEHVP